MRFQVATSMLLCLEAAEVVAKTKFVQDASTSHTSSTIAASDLLLQEEIRGIDIPSRSTRKRRIFPQVVDAATATLCKRHHRDITTRFGLQSKQSAKNQACDPSLTSSHDTDGSADVGVLAKACPSNQVCVETREESSPRSGTCQDLPVAEEDHRFLQELVPASVCNSQQTSSINYPSTDELLDSFNTGPSSSSFNYYYGDSQQELPDCDCSNFDYDIRQGNFTCTIYDNTCFDNDGLVCGSFTVERAFYGYVDSSLYCYSFDSPSSLEVCYEYTSLPDCSITVGGVTCQSCQVLDALEHPLDGSISYGCYQFDCTNTAAKIAGTDCLGDYVLAGVFESLLATDRGEEGTAPSDGNSIPIAVTRPPSLPPSSAPSGGPSSQPTERPTSRPSMAPSTEPSARPTQVSTSQPTRRPSPNPSASPSLRPTTLAPTMGTTTTVPPTTLPTQQPSKMPTEQPSTAPTKQSTPSPTNMPSYSKVSTTSSPIPRLTLKPSPSPTQSPSQRPSAPPVTARQPNDFEDDLTQTPTVKPTRAPVQVVFRTRSPQAEASANSRTTASPTSPNSTSSSRPARDTLGVFLGIGGVTLVVVVTTLILR